ncbi:MAG: hypothetical protein H0V49_13745 [Nocardioidaceae bacterium]|nr:hypothetical protein [Nocardioidaceae bacterium]
MSDDWVDGTLESGSDDGQDSQVDPDQETGVGLGQGEPSSFEPEEDEPATEPPS